MKHIQTFEARLSDISTFSGTNNNIKKHINKKFNEDTKLIDNIYLKKYNKNIIIDWYHNKKHNLITRIKNRTSLKSITEFNELFDKKINLMFDIYFDNIIE